MVTDNTSAKAGPKAAVPTVFLVDDDEAVRDALGLLLQANGFRVATFESAEKFLDVYRDGTPGCLVLDIRMEGMSGLALQNELANRGIGLPIVFITAHGDVPTAVGAIKKGALQFLEKPFADEQLLLVVREGIALDRRARQTTQDEASIESGLAALSGRERQVLDKVLAGKTSRQIADELFISVKTVDFHRGRIMQKLHVTSLRELFPVRSYLDKRGGPNASG